MSNHDLAVIIASKDAHRKELAQLPYSDKMEIVARMRERVEAFAPAKAKLAEQRAAELKRCFS